MIRINSAMKETYFDLRNTAGKVVEVVGLLLGFIVIALVEVSLDDYIGVHNYLIYTFLLGLICLFVSVTLGLYVCLNVNGYYSPNNTNLTEKDEAKLLEYL